MTKRTWTLPTCVGAAIAAGGVIAAAVGFSMDNTYPETVPGWAISMIWVGALVAVGSGIAKSLTKS